MRRRIGTVIAALALAVVLAGPAEAFHRETRCREHNGPDGAGGVQVSVCVQLNEGFVSAKLQAHTDWRGDLAQGDPYIQIQRVNSPYGLELRRARPGEPFKVIRGTSRGWTSMQAVEFVATTFYDPCSTTQQTYDYRSTMWYRLRFDGFPASPISQWYTLSSGTFRVYVGDC